MSCIDKFTTELIEDLEKKKEEFDVEHWISNTMSELKATNSVTCVVCGLDKFEYDMVKIFKEWRNGVVTSSKGICKRCWNFDEEGEI